jgi:hypothetical protein
VKRRKLITLNINNIVGSCCIFMGSIISDLDAAVYVVSDFELFFFLFRRENLVRMHFGLFVQCSEGLEWLKRYRTMSAGAVSGTL